ncbi:MAG: PGL/p-HBAD biosynthesis glycosyltransferase [Syntrophus sp. PtaU1.Bin005]|jgi:glycosyltransferase involved in cell wall biosynthesis|nr:MAG: PGL/p-HBAD biosynthesis glycosyltransferase [Syntrophus sp. PtaU1.Bin005]
MTINSTLPYSSSDETRRDTPLFTILTASLNGAGTLEETILSIRKQTTNQVQHIVIDGGSTDGTLDILKRYQKDYDLSWISEPDKGIADALNKGLRLAKGKYILVLQTDDQLLKKDSLEKAWAAIEKGPADFHIFPVMFDRHQKGRTLLTPVPFLWWNHFKFLFCHQGCFADRHVFEKIGLFRTEFPITFDYDFFYRALNVHCSVKFEDFPVTVMGAEGISSNPAFLFQRLEEEFQVQKSNEERLFWALAQRIFRILYLPYKRFAQSLTS